LELVGFLSEHEFFQGMSPDELARLCEQSEVRTFRPGEAIIHFGEPGRFLGVVLEGEAEAVRTAEEGRRETVGELPTGSYFGEMSLVSGEPTSADVVAASVCRILLIPHEVFRSLLAVEPTALQHIARTITLRLRQRPEEVEQVRPAPAEQPAEAALPSAKVLVVDCGPTRIQYSYYDAEHEFNDLTGLVDQLGTTRASHTATGLRTKSVTEAPTEHAGALRAVLERLTEGPAAPLQSPQELTAIAHRFAHGGEAFSQSVLVDDEVVQRIGGVSSVAPPENATNLLGLETLRKLAPEVPHVAVFDTAFHQRMPPRAFLYGLPRKLYVEQGLRRYGCHGIVHHQAALLAAEHVGRPLDELKIVTCHLGAEVSLCAIDRGRAIDTSAGLTPLEGPMSLYSSGCVGPGVVLHLVERLGLAWDEAAALLRDGGGVRALADVEGGFAEVREAAEKGDEAAVTAREAFCYQIKRYVGAYMAVLAGLDAMVFTGEIGHGDAQVRAQICQGLDCLGIRLDAHSNQEVAPGVVGASEVSEATSPVQVLVVATDEHRMMASEAMRVLGWESMAAAIRGKRHPIPISTSAHHVHLSQEHVETLFGPGHELTFKAQLSQPGQFACEESVTLVGPRGRVERVRVLGPAREQTQVEVSRTEEFKLGINAPTRHSGNLEGSPGLVLEGTAGRVELGQGVICAARHVHMSPEDALRFGVRDKDVIEVRVAAGRRPLVFGDVLVRVHPDFRLDMHVDTDEANAAELERDAVGFMTGIQGRA